MSGGEASSSEARCNPLKRTQLQALCRVDSRSRELNGDFFFFVHASGSMQVQTADACFFIVLGMRVTPALEPPIVVFEMAHVL